MQVTTELCLGQHVTGELGHLVIGERRRPDHGRTVMPYLRAMPPLVGLSGHPRQPITGEIARVGTTPNPDDAQSPTRAEQLDETQQPSVGIEVMQGRHGHDEVEGFGLEGVGENVALDVGDVGLGGIAIRSDNGLTVGVDANHLVAERRKLSGQQARAGAHIKGATRGCQLEQEVVVVRVAVPSIRGNLHR